MFHKTTFEVAGAKTDEEVIRGTSKQDSFGLTHMMVGSVFRRAPKQGTCTYTPASVHLSNMTAASRGIRNVRLGQLWEVAGLHDVDIIGGGLQHFALPRTWKGEVELNRRGMGRGAADSCVRCGSNVGGGLRRLLWLHINEEECHTLACSQARMSLTSRKDAHKRHRPCGAPARLGAPLRTSHSGTECTQ